MSSRGFSPPLNPRKSIMLPNEKFALECRAHYDEIGLVVDERNGQFAHCPYPEGMGESGYYLLFEHHQQQGILQSKDVNKCCFFVGHAKQWLIQCDPIPANYFDLWDIFDEYSKESLKKVHSIKNENGKSVSAVKHCTELHAERDENGKSIRGLKLAEKTNSLKDEHGKSVIASTAGKNSHKEKDESGKSVRALEHNVKLHEEKDEFGRSLVVMKVNNQIWESTIDGFRSNAGGVAIHNRAKGWDPKDRVRVY